MDILNKNPFELEATKPFHWFPPVLKRLVIFHVRGHFSNTQNMITVHNAINNEALHYKPLLPENQVDFWS